MSINLICVRLCGARYLPYNKCRFDVIAMTGTSVNIHSGSRCAKYNAKVGGTKKSEHLSTDDDPYADAVDIDVPGYTTKQLHMVIKELPYANLLGIIKVVFPPTAMYETPSSKPCITCPSPKTNLIGSILVIES